MEFPTQKKAKSALLLVDVQNVMFTSPKFLLHKKSETLANIKQLVQVAQRSATPIVYVQHDGGEGSALVRGSESWQIHPEIRPRKVDFIVEKTAPDAFLNTDLKATLEQLAITHLYIAGMQTEICVDTSCRSAKSHGYENMLVSDAHSTFDNEVLSAEQTIQHHNQVLTRFANVLPTKEVLTVGFFG